MAYGPRMVYAGVPSSLGLGLGVQSYSNFPASTVRILDSSLDGPTSARLQNFGIYCMFCFFLLWSSGALKRPGDFLLVADRLGRAYDALKSETPVPAVFICIYIYI